MGEAITFDPIKKENHSDDDEEENAPLSHLKAKKKPLTFSDDEELISLSKWKKKSSVKKELASDIVDDPVLLSSLKNKNTKAANGGAKAAGKVRVDAKMPSKVKKEGLDEEDFELNSLKKNIKVEKTKKENRASGKSTGAEVKRERKAYSLPGQKFDAPEERDPLRIFYETLHQQVPTSNMAALWMMERGLLPEKEAAKVYAMKLKSKQNQLRSPMKAISATKTVKVATKKLKVKPDSPDKSKSKPTKKRKANDDSGDEDDDDKDFILPTKRPRN